MANSGVATCCSLNVLCMISWNGRLTIIHCSILKRPAHNRLALIWDMVSNSQPMKHTVGLHRRTTNQQQTTLNYTITLWCTLHDLLRRWTCCCHSSQYHEHFAIRKSTGLAELSDTYKYQSARHYLTVTILNLIITSPPNRLHCHPTL